MAEKPRTAEGYSPEQVELVKGTCLFVARVLADYVDEIVIVGGLVPTLLIDQDHLADDVDRHVGTNDLDVALTVALLDDQRYQALTDRLRQSGFRPDVTDNGNPALQRWVYDGAGRVTLDFLIPPLSAEEKGGTLRHIESDFAAIVTPGLALAFKDSQIITLTGTSISGPSGTADIRVCGPGAFVILKALAFRGRTANKDAYDLYYVLRNYGTGVEDVVARLAPLLDASEAQEAIDILRREFLTVDGFGPWGAAEFITGGPDDAIQAEVVAMVSALLEGLKTSG